MKGGSLRLILCFNKDSLNDFLLGSEDIIILDGTYQSGLYHQIDINKIHLDHDKLNSEFNEYLEEIAGKPATFNALLKSAAPNIYLWNLRFLLNWIEAIKQSFDSFHITEVVFTDLIDYDAYMPYYEAEGEVNSKLFYKGYDFIPNQISQYLTRNHKVIKISVTKKHSIISLYFRIISRRYLVFLVKLAIQTFKVSVTKSRRISLEGKNILILSRSLVHTSYVKKILDSIETSVMLTADGYFSSSSNIEQGIKTFNDQSLSIYDYLCLSDIFSLCFKTLTRLFRLPYYPVMSINGVDIKISDLLKEVIIYQFDVDLQLKAVQKLLGRQTKKEIHTIITCEMITQYAFYMHEKFSPLGVKTMQLQVAELDMFRSPDFFFSDEFLFNSTKELELFSVLFPEKAYKMRFKGNTTFSENVKVRKPKQIDKIVIFSQPHELHFQLEILRELCALQKQFNFIAYLKLHPRQNIDQIAPQYTIEFPNLQFLSNDDKKYLDDCDLAITRVSSITNDLIIEGVPIINYLKSSFDQNATLKFLNKEFPTNVCSAIELKAVFVDYQRFLEAYEIFRLDYMKSCGIDAGVEALAKYLKGNLTSKS